MKCPTCKTLMETREGKFGKFYYCPKQYSPTFCPQSTISCSPTASQSVMVRMVTPGYLTPDIFQRSNEPLVQEMRILEAQAGKLFAPSEDLFVDELGDPIDPDDTLWRPW